MNQENLVKLEKSIQWQIAIVIKINQLITLISHPIMWLHMMPQRIFVILIIKYSSPIFGCFTSQDWHQTVALEIVRNFNIRYFAKRRCEIDR